MKDKDCIFCLLANGDIPTAKVYEDDELAVILDAGPATHGHALILPKDHYKNVTEIPETLAGKMLALAARIGQAQMDKLGAAGFNVLVNTNEAAGQTVFHMHMHVIPRYEGESSIVSWTPGEAVDTERTAALLAEALG